MRDAAGEARRLPALRHRTTHVRERLSHRDRRPSVSYPRFRTQTRPLGPVPTGACPNSQKSDFLSGGRRVLGIPGFGGLKSRDEQEGCDHERQAEINNPMSTLAVRTM